MYCAIAMSVGAGLVVKGWAMLGLVAKPAPTGGVRELIGFLGWFCWMGGCGLGGRGFTEET